MSITPFDEIIEQNDQTAARREHLEKLRELVGNPYPNKFGRSTLSGEEDTITRLLEYPPVAEINAEMYAILASLGEGERPPAEKKDALNKRLKALGNVRIAGRMAVPPRVMGKAAFVHLSDGISRLQVYVRKQDAVAISNDTGEPLDEEGKAWEVFGYLDHGDFIGVEGYLFITNTGELSVHVEKLQFLAKAMLPMPDKMHGIADPEIRQRQRYADLIASSLQIEHDGLTTREVFERRAKLISSIRHFLEDHGYIEVETPMLTPKATGAAAKPFKTHHNALDIDLYARIAPELYLKRLVVGGFEKVYELNRNFRNEGISYKHNPEFTMLEFYCAYMDVNGMMDFCEQLLINSITFSNGSLSVKLTNDPYADVVIDFSSFERISMREAVIRFWQNKGQRIGQGDLDIDWFDDIDKLRRLVLWTALIDNELRKSGMQQMNVATILNYDPKLESGDNDDEDDMGISIYIDVISKELGFWQATESINDSFKAGHETDFQRFETRIQRVLRTVLDNSMSEELQLARITQFLFEEVVERNLIQPTFIVDYPKSISPLSKASPQNPQVAERFELFINGMEVANGFSELNDPREQYDRFADQMKARESGDEEAMVLDEDYIRALSYGMPPAAGIGIGIDRLTMLLTNKHSIRDVILFPHMRPEKRVATEDTESKE
ncbi:MAG: lysine--tRNA ligase [Acidobacteria bacterium]|nr:lysine--tRNA ligase [Acidobacteriota bacterium]